MIKIETMLREGMQLIGSVALTEIVKGAVNSLIKPKLERMYSNTEMENRILDINEQIIKYIDKSCNNCLYMNTIVFKNEQKKIDDLYIPLTVRKSNTSQKDDDIEIIVNKYTDDFIPLYKKVLLVDTAGMGKSTLMKYLCLSSIKLKKGIPVLIELRKLQSNISILEFILNEMNGIREYFKKEDILNLIEEGDFIFFFDGYDEIISESKQAVTNNLQEFIADAGNNLFIISSREENELVCFGDFQRFDIKSLTNDEAYTLIRKYDKDGELSKELVAKLQEEENLKILSEFLENPLMVSLLYKAFEYKRTIPYKKHIFYRQVYDALFEEHDLSKGGAYNHTKRSKLDLEDFHRILRSIGFITLTKGIIYSKEELIEIVKKAKMKNRDLTFRENDFIYDITHSVPLFNKDGVEYRWSHKSFQEYFAASYISIDSKDKQEELLKALVKEQNINKYYNILDFCYDIDYKQFSRVILYPLIVEFDEFYKTHYCNPYYDQFDKEDVLVRKSLGFSYKDSFICRISAEDKERILAGDNSIEELFEYIFGKDLIGSIIINSELGIQSKSSQRIINLIKLLNNKKSNIVKNIECDHEIVEDIIENIQVGRYVVNDDINNYINRNDMFVKINNLILDARKKIVLDYSNCLLLKKSIEEEIKNQEDDLDFL